MNTTVGPILILSDEPIVAALVGILVELAEREPAFPKANEMPADALERVRPLGVILVDCAFAAARSDVFFARAAQKRVGVVVFGPEFHARQIGEIAARRSIPWLVLPPSANDVALAIASVRRRPLERMTQRRADAELTILPDGTPVFRDDDGRRWIVYDRRNAQDRRAPSTDRFFVAGDGERRQIALSEADSALSTITSLVAQLHRATSA